jgi:hypothetical protein
MTTDMFLVGLAVFVLLCILGFAWYIVSHDPTRKEPDDDV